MSNDSILKQKSMAFARRIVRLYQFLSKEKQEYVMSKQVLRSGTSIGANIAEAIYGSSRKDFVAKLYIAEKESAETLYWLELLNSCDYIPDNLYQSLRKDCRELLSMLAASIKSSS
ncbi:MAG: four helix bundle protein [Mailhella sp.]|nr:four helix bundle protein [Mailhella sp.]